MKWRVYAGARLLPLLIASLLAQLSSARAAECPRRADVGDLIVLRVCGDYYEMGRQQVMLLEQEPPERFSLARQYDFQRSAYYRGLAGAGLGARLLDELVLPVLVPLDSIRDGSGYFHESHGIANALGVSRADALRFQLGALSGSTVFVATGSATADHGAIIGRNVDWEDHYGIERPVVAIFSPKGAELSFVTVNWPLAGAPAIGMNSAGLALSFNWFEGADDPFTLFRPAWKVRTVLQTAHTVAEAESMFTSGGGPGIAGFFSLADATGNIGLVECTASSCAVDHDLGTWFSQANDALTPQMFAHQTDRSETNIMRKTAMDDAVRPDLGRISPEIATEILRNHVNTPHIDHLAVANPGVLISAVAQPSTRTLWVSTTRQPLAPFGEYVPFSPDGSPRSAALPADPALSSQSLQHYASIVGELRAAARSYDERKIAEAAQILDRVGNDPLMDPAQLSWGLARLSWAEGNRQQAARLLQPLDREDVLFDLRILTVLARAVIADQEGHRPQAMALYRRGLQVMDAHPTYRADDIRQELTEGLSKPMLRSAVIDGEPLIEIPR